MKSPVLIIGDVVISKKAVEKAKKKYKSYYWETVSLKEQSFDEIRMLSGFIPMGCSKKIVLLTNLKNQKAMREFVASLVQTSCDDVKFIIWDSDGVIKIDPKKGINKTWQAWIDELSKNSRFFLLNNGSDFADNDQQESASFVQEQFKRWNKNISYDIAKLFIQIVGKNRSMIVSEVEKMGLACPQTLTQEYIIRNAYPASKEAVLYKFGDDMDRGYPYAIDAIERYMGNGVNANVLAKIIMTKARWQLAIFSMFNSGKTWSEIRVNLLSMGKFPYDVWKSPKITDAKKKEYCISMNKHENLKEYMNRKLGIPEHALNFPVQKTVKKTLKKGESIPLPFLADAMIKQAKDIFALNKNRYPDKELRQKLVDRSVNVYCICSDSLKEIRYDVLNQKKELYNMALYWTYRYV